MNNLEKEQFYDEHIAPELLKLGKLCQDNKLSFLAAVEWAPESDNITLGTTCSLTAEASSAICQAYREAIGKGKYSKPVIEED